MASRRRGRKPGDGAAAEPEPSARSTATTGYDVRSFQNPDAGAADQPRSRTKGKGKGKTKRGGCTSTCFTCGKSGAKLQSCGQCHRAYYCGREVSPRACVRVSAGSSASAGSCAASSHHVSVCPSPYRPSANARTGHGTNGRALRRWRPRRSGRRGKRHGRRLRLRRGSMRDLRRAGGGAGGARRGVVRVTSGSCFQCC